MPRYFFHVFGEHELRDKDGEELPDDRAARQVAVRTFGEMIRDRRDWLDRDGGMRLIVEREPSSPIFTLEADARSAT